MSADIQFPAMQCALCPTPVDAKSHNSPGIGTVCPECVNFTKAAMWAIAVTPGIAPWPLPDHEPKNSRKPRRNRKKA